MEQSRRAAHRRGEAQPFPRSVLFSERDIIVFIRFHLRENMDKSSLKVTLKAQPQWLSRRLEAQGERAAKARQWAARLRSRNGLGKRAQGAGLLLSGWRVAE